MSNIIGFTKDQLLSIFRTMVISRKMDDRMLVLIRQGKAFFHIGCAGHEAAQIAAAMTFQVGKDWAYPYYREQAFCLQWGCTPEELFLLFLAKRDDPSSGGRQMPQHYGHAKLKVVSQSSPTGTQYLQAVGTAMGTVRSDADEVVYVGSGEGTTSQGDFHEALNWASRDKLPIVFHVQDNRYAISVPIEQQAAGASVYKLASGYENLYRTEVDGTNFFKAHQAFAKAVSRARSGKGPSVVVSKVVRLMSHSSSDDQRKYRTTAELKADLKRDPIRIFTKECQDQGFATDKEFAEIEEKAKQAVDEAARWAAAQPDPEPNSALRNVFVGHEASAAYSEAPTQMGESVVLVDAINHALHEEAARNDKILIYGQDVADEKGGVFTATKGLSKRFGSERVFNSPLAESSIIGTAIGLAVYGFKPVVEIQFGDYIWTAMMQLRNEAATMRYRSNGSFSAAMVIRVPVGGYIHGGLCHSQSIEGFFTHMVGMRVVYPSNAADAKGLLKTAIRGQDPVLFLEHKALYRQQFSARPEPDSDYLLPFGRAAVVQPGDDLTIITWGMMVQRSLDALRQLKDLSPSVEVIDLRTLNPVDMDTILVSIKKTNRVLIVHEENLIGGFGAEISARITSQAFEFLDAPILRVAAKDTPIPYNPILEARVLPQVREIVDTIKRLLSY